MGVIEWQEFVVGAWWTLVNVRQNSYYFTIILDNVFPLGTLYNVYISILTKNNRTNITSDYCRGYDWEHNPWTPHIILV